MEERKVVGPMSPPKFPGEEAFKAAHERFLAWKESEEGRAFLKEHVPPETYAELFPEDKTEE